MHVDEVGVLGALEGEHERGVLVRPEVGPVFEAPHACEAGEEVLDGGEPHAEGAGGGDVLEAVYHGCRGGPWCHRGVGLGCEFRDVLRCDEVLCALLGVAVGANESYEAPAGAGRDRAGAC